MHSNEASTSEKKYIETILPINLVDNHYAITIIAKLYCKYLRDYVHRDSEPIHNICP